MKNKSSVIGGSLLSLASAKIGDWCQLVKIRLSLVVVISSMLGYLISAHGDVNGYILTVLIFGGMAVTFSANAMNQVLEKDFDILMKRTQNRPVTTGRMRMSEVVLFSGISCLIGIILLGTINAICAFLAMISFVLYAFVYTPMKRYSTMSVAVGAIPGALPVLIGCVASDFRLTVFAFVLFLIQFLWQFPHFWAIGFLGFEDYTKAGFKLLPAKDGAIDRNLGFSATFYSILIFPLVYYLFVGGFCSGLSATIVSILTILYSVFCYRFHIKFDRKAALYMMFYSFIYLPLVLITFLLF